MKTMKLSTNELKGSNRKLFSQKNLLRNNASPGMQSNKSKGASNE